tara:strand:- start:4169 stop:4378 length:210 start_codon:yes stop_codon:yes gene_type:complete
MAAVRKLNPNHTTIWAVERAAEGEEDAERGDVIWRSPVSKSVIEKDTISHAASWFTVPFFLKGVHERFS